MKTSRIFGFSFVAWKRWWSGALLVLLNAKFFPGSVFGQLRFPVSSSVLTSCFDSANFNGIKPVTMKIGFDNKKFVSKGSQEDWKMLEFLGHKGSRNKCSGAKPQMIESVASKATTDPQCYAITLYASINFKANKKLKFVTKCVN